MTGKIVFYIPYNYKHGMPDTKYFSERVSVLNVAPRTQENLNEIFKKTKIYETFKYLSFNYYFEWKPLLNTFDEYYAYPKIFVMYNDLKLVYFHLPSIKDIKFDIYLAIGEINNINENNDLINCIDKNNLQGEYIIDIKNEHS